MTETTRLLVGLIWFDRAEIKRILSGDEVYRIPSGELVMIAEELDTALDAAIARAEAAEWERDALRGRLDYYEPVPERFVDHDYSKWLYANWQRLANLPQVREMFGYDAATHPAPAGTEDGR